MKKFVVVLMSLMVILCSGKLSAENIELDIRQITMQDGLSANSVRCMLQDSMGFIWIGTINNGLCKYDGAGFSVIYPEYGSEPGLADPRISSMSEDEYGHLWIKTMSDQISCYDLKSEKFVDYSGNGHFNDHYGHVTFTDDGIWLWGATQGCMRVDFKDGVFTSRMYSTQTDDLPSDHVTFILEEGEDIWFGTTGGLCRYKHGRMEVAVPSVNFCSAEKLESSLIFISTEGDIWRMNEGGLSHALRIDRIYEKETPITGMFSPDGVALQVFTTDYAYTYDDVDVTVMPAGSPYDLIDARVMSDGKGNYLIYDREGNVVFADAVMMWEKRMNLRFEKEAYWTTRYGFTRTDDDVVWISTHDNGLFAYDIMNDDLQQFRMARDYDGKSSNILMCVMEDRSGNLWVGSEYSGLYKANVINRSAEYKHFYDGINDYSDMVRNIHVRNNGDTWVCTRDGSVYVYDDALVNVKYKDKYDANVYSILDDVSGLWVGTRGKGLIVDGKRFLHDKNDPYSLSSDIIFDIVKDNSGDVWVGTFGGGVNLALDDQNGGYVFRSFFNDSYSRRHTRVLCLDSNGYIWAGNSNGVIVFDPEELKDDPFKYHTYNSNTGHLRSNECRAIVCDAKGRIWVSETGVGFSVCVPGNYSNLDFRHYSQEDGLVSGLVQGFAEDDYGRMWITTEYGVSCFNPETENFRNFIFSSTMQSNVCLDNSAVKSADGRILIGTGCGMAVVDPSEISMDVKPLIHRPVFTSLLIHGSAVKPGDDEAPVGCSIAYSSDVTLEYVQNSFSLSFSTLDYVPGILYSYMLKGYDDEWSPASELNTAVYKNIPSGKYVFKVKACDASGEWLDMPTDLYVSVKPPFYRSAIAYCVYLLVFIGVLFVAHKIFSRMTKLRNEAKMEKQLTEYKLMFFTNISHEFRTPLTLILHSLEKLRKSELSSSDRSAMRTMEAGTTRLLRLVNQLLEFRKLQNDKHALRLQQTDVVKFCQEIFDIFQESASAKNIDFSFRASEPEYVMNIDQGDMDKVIYNLVSNAIKYTPERGKVEVVVSVLHSESRVRIEVIDNGIGVPKERRKDIFTRFSPGENSESSMGIGLNLTKALVDANKGEIHYSENPQGGTIMSVYLPTDPAVYSLEDFMSKEKEIIREQPRLDVVQEMESADMPVKPLNPHKILVVEDEYEIRKLIVEELCGYFNVVEASVGDEALRLLRSDNSIELVVCDVMMPGISGYEVTAAIKEDFATCHVPVVLLTALDSENRRIDGFKSGADAYITKPFRPDYVLTRILKLLEQRNRLREKFSNDLSLKAEEICTNDLDREFMDKVGKVLEKQLSNSDFSVDDFAREMAMGRSSFYNKIHKVTGHSPNQYIRILRMKKAAELILTGKYTATEVAYKVGIQDPSYFSKSFREQFGISPKAYLKQATAGLNQDSSQDD